MCNMSMRGSGALAARPTDKELDKGRVEKTTVRRYRAGQAPAWAEQQAPASAAATAAQANALAVQVQRTAIAAPVVLKRADDPRLNRLAQRQVRGPEIVRRRHRTPESGEGDDDEQQRRACGDEDEEEEEEAARPRRRRGEQEDEEEEEEEEQQQQDDEQEEDEEELQQRREALRERLRLQQQKQEQELQAQQGAEEEEEEEEESEYTTDSDDDEDDGPGGRRLIKPVFVPKGDRETLAERDALDQEEEQVAEAEKQRAQQRKLESRQLVVQAIAAEEAEIRAMAAGSSRPAGREEDVVTDDEDADTAFDEWKGREMSRIARDRDEREAADRDARERERLKNMTEAERAAWEKANPKEAPPDSKAKWKFLQKYWHKGAFFQEAPDDTRGTAGTDAIFSRDYSAPVGEDRGVDKASLPAVMQVKNFGRTGRTKWTHLLAEDTSAARKEDEWYQARLKPNAATGAVSGGFARTGGAVAPAGGGFKRAGYGGEEFSKPKKFKT